jgi:hypothetical protein
VLVGNQSAAACLYSTSVAVCCHAGWDILLAFFNVHQCYVIKFCKFYRNVIYCVLSALKDVIMVFCYKIDVNYIASSVSQCRVGRRIAQENAGKRRQDGGCAK